MLVIMVVIALAATVNAAGSRAIGVYFDEEARNNNASFIGGYDVVHTAYVCVTNSEMRVAGAAFKLELDPQILLLTATYPAGLAIGDVTAGVEVGMTDPVVAVMGDAAVVCTMQLTTLDQLMVGAELRVVNHPNYANPIVSDADGVLWDCTGITSYLTIPVENEMKSWGEVKALFQ